MRQGCIGLLLRLRQAVHNYLNNLPENENRWNAVGYYFAVYLANQGPSVVCPIGLKYFLKTYS